MNLLTKLTAKALKSIAIKTGQEYTLIVHADGFHGILYTRQGSRISNEVVRIGTTSLGFVVRSVSQGAMFFTAQAEDIYRTRNTEILFLKAREELSEASRIFQLLRYNSLVELQKAIAVCVP